MFSRRSHRHLDIPTKVRRRQSDAKWRANVASCYETLKLIIPVSKRATKRQISKALILQETSKHISFLEEILEILLLERAKLTHESTAERRAKDEMGLVLEDFTQKQRVKLEKLHRHGRLKKCENLHWKGIKPSVESVLLSTLDVPYDQEVEISLDGVHPCDRASTASARKAFSTKRGSARSEKNITSKLKQQLSKAASKRKYQLNFAVNNYSSLVRKVSLDRSKDENKSDEEKLIEQKVPKTPISEPIKNQPKFHESKGFVSSSCVTSTLAVPKQPRKCRRKLHWEENEKDSPTWDNTKEDVLQMVKEMEFGSQSDEGYGTTVLLDDVNLGSMVTLSSSVPPSTDPESSADPACFPYPSPPVNTVHFTSYLDKQLFETKDRPLQRLGDYDTPKATRESTFSVGSSPLLSPTLGQSPCLYTEAGSSAYEVHNFLHPDDPMLKFPFGTPDSHKVPVLKQTPESGFCTPVLPKGHLLDYTPERLYGFSDCSPDDGSYFFCGKSKGETVSPVFKNEAANPYQDSDTEAEASVNNWSISNYVHPGCKDVKTETLINQPQKNQERCANLHTEISDFLGSHTQDVLSPQTSGCTPLNIKYTIDDLDFDLAAPLEDTPCKRLKDNTNTEEDETVTSAHTTEYYSPCFIQKRLGSTEGSDHAGSPQTSSADHIPNTVIKSSSWLSRSIEHQGEYLNSVPLGMRSPKRGMPDGSVVLQDESVPQKTGCEVSVGDLESPPTTPLKRARREKDPEIGNVKVTDDAINMVESSPADVSRNVEASDLFSVSSGLSPFGTIIVKSEESTHAACTVDNMKDATDKDEGIVPQDKGFDCLDQPETQETRTNNDTRTSCPEPKYMTSLLSEKTALNPDVMYKVRFCSKLATNFKINSKDNQMGQAQTVPDISNPKTEATSVSTRVSFIFIPAKGRSQTTIIRAPRRMKCLPPASKVIVIPYHCKTRQQLAPIVPKDKMPIWRTSKASTQPTSTAYQVLPSTPPAKTSHDSDQPRFTPIPPTGWENLPQTPGDQHVPQYNTQDLSEVSTGYEDTDLMCLEEMLKSDSEDEIEMTKNKNAGTSHTTSLDQSLTAADE